MKRLVLLAFVLRALAADAAPIDKVSLRPDGSSICWTVDRQSTEEKQGISLVAQGSGCLAATENPNITIAKGLLTAFAVLTVEKYGIEPHAKPSDPFGGCPSAFYSHYTVSQRVIDYERVLGELRREPWWNGQLVLFGGSEGGGAISILAPRVNPTAVVIFSAAPGYSFAEIFKLSVPPEVARQADAEFKKIEAEPLSAKVWGETHIDGGRTLFIRTWPPSSSGVSHRFSSFKVSEIRMPPVAVARQIRDDFARAGHRNLSYWEFAGYDHGMQDVQGVSHLNEVMARISRWISDRLAETHDVKSR